MKDEDRAKEQLVVDANLRFDTSPAELAGMRRRIAELEATETERRGVEELLWKLTHDLGERVKELTCLYGISHLVEKPDISLEEIIQGAVDLFPPAWQYPEITCARVILEDQEFKTENFGETMWKQASDIVVYGERAGTIEVCYLEERPESHEGPFLKEEKSLLDAVAERLGRIIERNRAEAALRESEARYRALFDQANDAIFLENKNEEIVDVNRRACQLTGYSREELLAMRTPDLEAEEARLDPPHKVYSTPDVATEDTPFETVVLHRDGTEIPVEVTITGLMSSGGDLFLSIVRDITERKRAEEALQRAHDELERWVEERTAKLEAANEQLEREIEERKQAEEAAREVERRFRNLFENAPLCVFEVDLTQTPPAILEANRQAEAVYGWSAAEFRSVPIERVIPPQAAAGLIRLVDRGRAGETITIESTNLRRDGSAFPARISATLEAGSDASWMIIAVEDITVEKQRRSEEEAIAEERRRIAHEIHDGLAQNLAALRFRDRLWHKLVDTDPAQMHAQLDELREILSASIREVRRSIFALRPVSLEELGFFPALRRFTTEFGEQYQLYVNLRIFGPEVRLPSSLELTLFRVVQEALNNVGKHARASTVWIRLDVEATDAVALTIRDDGRGFDPASLSQAVRYGHLGLKQMRERVESANGTLLIQSQPGSGAEVRVVLPLEKS